MILPPLPLRRCEMDAAAWGNIAVIKAQDYKMDRLSEQKTFEFPLTARLGEGI